MSVNTEIFYQKWLNYKIDTGLDISFNDFWNPKILEDIHFKNVGTVFKKYDKRFKDISHFTHFGKMFFYEYIRIKEMQKHEI